SEEDHKIFFYILQHSGKIAKDLAKCKLTPADLAKVSNIIFINRSQIPINSIFNFYKAAEYALNKIQIPIKKTAYPQGDGFGFTEATHNVQKWVNAMREIYALAQQPGHDIGASFNKVTSDWDKMERKDFKHWMSFYEENAQNKYKTAADAEYYQAAPGVMIPMEHLRAKLPTGPDMTQFDRQNAAETAAQQKQEIEAKKREEIKKKLKAIISRLNSAERLATDPEVQKDLQHCLDIGVPKWLEELQRVKRLIQLAPMRSSASPILEDIIIRQANILAKQGHPKAAKEMRKLAQAPAPPGPAVDPGAPPGMNPPQAMPSGPAGGDDGKEALDELVEGMNFSDDEGDTNDIEDMEDDPLAAITVMAQAAPDAPAPAEPPAKAGPEPAIDVNEPAASTPMDSKTDTLFETALSGVTIHDVVGRLETLANLFRTREIPRQLAIIDLMMDKLNISAFFPSLAEASSKSLESNQYALTRVEDVLSKLRGSIETPKHMELDLTGKGNGLPSKPLPAQIDTESVRQGLAVQEQQDKARKERRKAEDDATAAQAAQPAAPAGEVVTNAPEELAQPANIVPGQPTG
ncbi:MAG TPA: hypothetical protein VM577_10020, partial [Anaerovoracaceae bacterium]|nr:hypothetical protein [Anaerovoracaceae bacterium]